MGIWLAVGGVIGLTLSARLYYVCLERWLDALHQAHLLNEPDAERWETLYRRSL